MRIHWLQHVPFEDLGCIAPILIGQGHSLSATPWYVDTPAVPAPDAFDALIVMGGPMGVADEAQYPWLSGEKRLIRAALDAGKPVLGICLGAQLIAHVLGAPVTRNPEPEIGWFDVERTDAGRGHPLLAGIPERMRVFHWHGDTFDLPDGAVHLASTPVCAHQAFSLGPRVLALQFHLEATAGDLETWFVGHTAEIAATPGLSVSQLRADTDRCAPEIAFHGAKIFRDWLDGAGL